MQVSSPKLSSHENFSAFIHIKKKIICTYCKIKTKYFFPAERKKKLTLNFPQKSNVISYQYNHDVV